MQGAILDSPQMGPYVSLEAGSRVVFGGSCPIYPSGRRYSRIISTRIEWLLTGLQLAAR
jgi:hypothetical protein